MLVLFFGTAVYNGSVPCLIFKVSTHHHTTDDRRQTGGQ